MPSLHKKRVPDEKTTQGCVAKKSLDSIVIEITISMRKELEPHSENRFGAL